MESAYILYGYDNKNGSLRLYFSVNPFVKINPVNPKILVQTYCRITVTLKLPCNTVELFPDTVAGDPLDKFAITEMV